MPRFSKYTPFSTKVSYHQSFSIDGVANMSLNPMAPNSARLLRDVTNKKDDDSADVEKQKSEQSSSVTNSTEVENLRQTKPTSVSLTTLQLILDSKGVKIGDSNSKQPPLNKNSTRYAPAIPDSPPEHGTVITIVVLSRKSLGNEKSNGFQMVQSRPARES